MTIDYSVPVLDYDDVLERIYRCDDLDRLWFWLGFYSNSVRQRQAILVRTNELTNEAQAHD